MKKAKNESIWGLAFESMKAVIFLLGFRIDRWNIPMEVMQFVTIAMVVDRIDTK